MTNEIIRKLIKILKLIKKPSLLFVIIKHRVAASIEHEFLFKNYSIDTVIDIGANKGQFALIANYFNNKCKIYSFEPLLDPYNKFNRVFSGKQNVSSFQVAISPHQGKQKFYVSKQNDSSSLLKIGKSQTEYFKNTELLREEFIDCGKLNQFIKYDDLSGTTLMKIDVQGYELNVLKSSKDFFKHIDFIYCEVSFQELYEEQSLVNEIIRYMHDNDFELCDIRCPVYKNNNLIQSDMLFKNIGVS